MSCPHCKSSNTTILKINLIGNSGKVEGMQLHKCINCTKTFVSNNSNKGMPKFPYGSVFK